MNKVKHCEYRNADVTIIDVARHVDGDGFILDMTDAEVAKVRQIPERYEVIEVTEKPEPKAVVEKIEPVVAHEIVIPKTIETKSTPKSVASVKRGRPSNRK